MRKQRPLISMLVVGLVFTVSTCSLAQDDRYASLKQYEAKNVLKVLQLSDQTHSTILFSLADEVTGVASSGKLRWIDTANSNGSGCDWAHPALAHRTSKIAFTENGDLRNHCRLVVMDLNSNARQTLMDVADYGIGEITWSWDDTEILYFNRGVQSISSSSKKIKSILPLSEMRTKDREYSYWAWYPLQWLHDDGVTLVEFEIDVPTGKPGESIPTSDIFTIRDGRMTNFARGSRPSVSPLSDRVAYFSDDSIKIGTIRGGEHRTILRAPRQLTFIREDWSGRPVWSPDASKLIVGTMVSENRRDKLYILDLEHQKLRPFLSKTSISIRDWRTY